MPVSLPASVVARIGLDFRSCPQMLGLCLCPDRSPMPTCFLLSLKQRQGRDCGDSDLTGWRSSRSPDTITMMMICLQRTRKADGELGRGGPDLTVGLHSPVWVLEKWSLVSTATPLPILYLSVVLRPFFFSSSAKLIIHQRFACDGALFKRFICLFGFQMNENQPASTWLNGPKWEQR